MKHKKAKDSEKGGREHRSMKRAACSCCVIEVFYWLNQRERDKIRILPFMQKKEKKNLKALFIECRAKSETSN